MKKPKKKGLIRYNIILGWSTSKRPFITQKLSFNAPVDFKLACKEAIKLKNTLWRAGGLDKNSVRILALSIDNVLQEYYKENAPYILRQQEDLKDQVKRFNKESKDATPAAKAGLKAKKIKLKDADFKFTIGAEAKPLKKKKRKVVVQGLPEPMVNATKNKKFSKIAKHR